LAGEREFESISVHGESGANLASRLPRWSRPRNSMTFRSGYGHRMGRARDRKFADSALEEIGFEPPVPTCARRSKPPPNLAWLMPRTSEATFTVAIAYYPDRDSRDLSGIPIGPGAGESPD